MSSVQAPMPPFQSVIPLGSVRVMLLQLGQAGLPRSAIRIPVLIEGMLNVMVASCPGVFTVTEPCAEDPTAGKLIAVVTSGGTLLTVTLAVPVLVPPGRIPNM